MRGAIKSGLLVGALLVFGCRKQFSGDGVVVDSGFWSYPRYSIAFDPLDPTNGADRTYKFTGTPGAKMTFGFVVVSDSGRADAKTLFRSSETDWMSLDVKITKEGGATVASTKAALKDWQFSESPQRIMLWHDKLRDVNFDRRSVYRINIDVSGVAAATNALRLRPVLEGGGNETP